MDSVRRNTVLDVKLEEEERKVSKLLKRTSNYKIKILILRRSVMLLCRHIFLRSQNIGCTSNIINVCISVKV